MKSLLETEIKNPDTIATICQHYQTLCAGGPSNQDYRTAADFFIGFTEALRGLKKYELNDEVYFITNLSFHVWKNNLATEKAA